MYIEKKSKILASSCNSIKKRSREGNWWNNDSKQLDRITVYKLSKTFK